MKKILLNALCLVLVFNIGFLDVSALSISDSFDDGQQLQSQWTYEVEPNNNFNQANYMGEFLFGEQTKYISGIIGNAFTDLDVFEFDMATSGRITIYGWWWGSHKGKSWEDDLMITLYAFNGSYIASSSYIYAGSASAQVLEIDLIPQPWYLVISTRSNSYTSLYHNEEYAISVQFEQTSTPVSLRISDFPTKRNYLYGEFFDVTNGRVEVGFNDGSKGYAPLTHDMISGFNPFASSFGAQRINVDFLNMTTTFEVYLDRFSDVPYGHPTYARINDLADKGIINGYRDGTFKPTNFITRAQAAVMIVRALGLDYRGKTSNFVDVPPTHASYEFISAAYEAGIISGYSVDGTFRPTQNITRAQIAVMIQRAFSIQHSGTEVGFSDVPDGYSPQRFIEALASQKIINGYSDGTFRPTNNTTRAQFSSMIYNAMRYGK